jgi:hypothetical protein
MRLALLLFLILVLAPIASATHPASRADEEQLRGGSAMVMAIEAVGGVVASGNGVQRTTSSVLTATHAYSWSYSWGGTVELRLEPDGTLRGDAQLTGGGIGRLNDHSHAIYDEGESDSYTDCEVGRDLASPPRNGRWPARGVIDEEKGTLIVLVQSISLPWEQTQDCATSGTDQPTETRSFFPHPPLSPLMGEGVTLLATRSAPIERLDPDLDELNAASSLLFEIPLGSGHSIHHGRTSGAVPVQYGTPAGHACPNAMNGHIMTGSCTASGTLQVRAIIDPCPMLRESRAVHAAAVSALKQPASGSSESQVRAFQVDAGQRMRALMSDERAIQLICGEDDTSLAMIGAVAQMVVDAWEDVAKTHGLSNDGKLDYLSAERQNQLLGASDRGSGEILGAILSDPGHGAITIKAHSPVALHAWDEAGRHVGWNETTNATDLQIEGANYTGEPGGAQELLLPSGFYKVATVELGEGGYTLNSGWNGTGGEGFELLPLKSKAGRTLVTNYLLDHMGLFAGPTQRIASAADAPFTFVETWRPLANEPILGAGPTGAGARGADTTSGDAPLPGLALAILALAAAAGVSGARGGRRG